MEVHFFPYVCHDVPVSIVKTVFLHRIILVPIPQNNCLCMFRYISKLSIWYYCEYSLLKLVVKNFLILKNEFEYIFWNITPLSFPVFSYFIIPTYIMYFKICQFFPNYSLIFCTSLFLYAWLYLNILQFLNLSFWIKIFL